MGLRYQRRFKLFPGVRLNLGLRSASVSIGGRAGRVSVGSRGATGTVDLPVTGLRYQTQLGKRGVKRSPRRKASALSTFLSFLAVVYLILYALGLV